MEASRGFPQVPPPFTSLNARACPVWQARVACNGRLGLWVFVPGPRWRDLQLHYLLLVGGVYRISTDLPRPSSRFGKSSTTSPSDLPSPSRLIYRRFRRTGSALIPMVHEAVPAPRTCIESLAWQKLVVRRPSSVVRSVGSDLPRLRSGFSASWEIPLMRPNASFNCARQCSRKAKWMASGARVGGLAQHGVA